ncbi:hypothetical protein Lnau_2220 [Legionella nautarum]|uniref:Uncharacterized protein n=1 Tax=Legionella nautarum TaxID=45070 RepID=A0A0W0WN88_9GAMM|nr:hypothetical protein [Legionella nautarum]KTD33743.1 hypothetical protein Lnau_2220 [Legionella nautarum]
MREKIIRATQNDISGEAKQLLEILTNLGFAPTVPALQQLLKELYPRLAAIFNQIYQELCEQKYTANENGVIVILPSPLLTEEADIDPVIEILDLYSSGPRFFGPLISFSEGNAELRLSATQTEVSEQPIVLENNLGIGIGTLVTSPQLPRSNSESDFQQYLEVLSQQPLMASNDIRPDHANHEICVLQDNPSSPLIEQQKGESDISKVMQFDCTQAVPDSKESDCQILAMALQQLIETDSNNSVNTFSCLPGSASESVSNPNGYFTSELSPFEEEELEDFEHGNSETQPKTSRYSLSEAGQFEEEELEDSESEDKGNLPKNSSPNLQTLSTVQEQTRTQLTNEQTNPAKYLQIKLKETRVYLQYISDLCNLKFFVNSRDYSHNTNLNNGFANKASIDFGVFLSQQFPASRAFLECLWLKLKSLNNHLSETDKKSYETQIEQIKKSYQDSIEQIKDGPKCVKIKHAADSRVCEFNRHYFFVLLKTLLQSIYENLHEATGGTHNRLNADTVNICQQIEEMLARYQVQQKTTGSNYRHFLAILETKDLNSAAAIRDSWQPKPIELTRNAENKKEIKKSNSRSASFNAGKQQKLLLCILHKLMLAWDSDIQSILNKASPNPASLFGKRKWPENENADLCSTNQI